jgi:hypothetical protein
MLDHGIVMSMKKRLKHNQVTFMADGKQKILKAKSTEDLEHGAYKKHSSKLYEVLIFLKTSLYIISLY